MAAVPLLTIFLKDVRVKITPQSRSSRAEGIPTDIQTPILLYSSITAWPPGVLPTKL